MAANTATGAEKKNTRTVTFRSREHKDFYFEHIKKCRYQDTYHMALVYCLGIDRDTRANVDRIYDFKSGCVKTECLRDGWQTSGSMKIVRMALNLYCDGTPSVFDLEDADGQLRECRYYTAGELFCCDYAKFFGKRSKSAIRSIVFNGREGSYAESQGAGNQKRYPLVPAASGT